MSAKGCRRRVTAPNLKTAWDQMRAVSDAVNALRDARDKLVKTKAAPNVVRRIRLALASAYGAHRHAVGLYWRARGDS